MFTLPTYALVAIANIMSAKLLTYSRVVLVLLLLTVVPAAWAQRATTVRGVVIDSLTHEPLPHVAVLLAGSGTGTKTDADGKFSITTQSDFTHVRFSLLGYKAVDRDVRMGRSNRLKIELPPTSIPLEEVMVRPRKEKYSKKNNPAVDLARKLIALHRDSNSCRNAFFSQRKYEKITFAFDNFDGRMRSNALFKREPLLLSYIDTSDVTHKPILNLAIKERTIDYYSRSEPEAVREVVTGIRRSGLDGFINQDNMQAYANEMLREVDLFSNDIKLFDQQFVSPLSQYAVSFYKYYLLDTLVVEGEKCIDLGFASYNAQSFGFAGHLYVVYEDSSYFVKRARYTIPQDINMNYVSRMILQQDYQRDSLGNRVKVYDDVVAEFRIANDMPGLYARRTVYYTDFSYDPPLIEDIFDGKQREVTLPGAYERNNDFWVENRAVPLRMQEDAIGMISTRLLEIPAVKWTAKVLRTLISGYVATHPVEDESRFDFGPITTFISGNSIEGLRLKLGGTTTARLHPRLFASGYVGYGFDDNKGKYGAALEYSFNDKRQSAVEYPIRSIKAYYGYDLNYLSQRYLHTQRDNFVLSLRRGPDYNATYMRNCGVNFKYEFAGGFSLELGLRNERQESTPYLPFEVKQPDGSINTLSHFSQTMGEVCLSYSPTEKFFTSYGERRAISSDAPVVTLRHTFALKGLLSEYTYHHTELAASKRFRMSKLGYADLILKAGKVWNDVPYPLLIIPFANMSYTVQPESYTLLSPMEFIFDQYASWDLTYFANGLLFNHIPYINKWRLREVVTFRGIYGTIRDNNFYPDQTGLFLFNKDWNVKRMNGMPYMEVGVGIDNILSVLRIEYVFRVTYRDTPGVDKGGLRVGLHLTF